VRIFSRSLKSLFKAGQGIKSCFIVDRFLDKALSFNNLFSDLLLNESCLLDWLLSFVKLLIIGNVLWLTTKDLSVKRAAAVRSRSLNDLIKLLIVRLISRIRTTFLDLTVTGPSLKRAVVDFGTGWKLNVNMFVLLTTDIVNKLFCF
jgi:hypothetical protein